MPALAERTSNRAADAAVINQISNLKFALERSKASLDALFGKIKSNIDEASRSKIESALYELQPTAG